MRPAEADGSLNLRSPFRGPSVTRGSEHQHGRADRSLVAIGQGTGGVEAARVDGYAVLAAQVLDRRVVAVEVDSRVVA